MDGGKILEGQLGSNLHTPLEVDNPGDLSCSAGIDTRVGICEIRMVEGVERIPLEVQMNSFHESKSLLQR